LSIGDIVDRAFRIYRARFRPMLLTALAILVPLALATGVLNYVVTSQAMREDSFDLAIGLVSGLGSILVAVVTWLAQGLAELALTFHALAALRGARLEPRESISKAGARLGPWLGMSLLRGLAYAAMFAMLLLPTIGITVLSEETPNLAIAFCMVPFLMLGVVGLFLYLQTRWVVSTLGLVVEELGATAALGRSWGLTRGKFWRSFAVMLVLGLIALIVLALPSFAIQMFALGASTELPLPSAIGTFLSTVVSALFVPLTASAYTVLYYDLRVRRENLDLEQRVGQLESELQSGEEQPS
jgi:hypothetical protein